MVSRLIHSQFCSRIDESFLSRWECRTYTSDEYEEMQRTLFEHLCPLLIIKMLPMKTFDDLDSSIMYGHLIQNTMLGINSCLAYLPFWFAYLFVLPSYTSKCGLHVQDLAIYSHGHIFYIKPLVWVLYLCFG